MKLPPYLFSSSCDGCLYDTRKPNWHAMQPLRPLYSRHLREIETGADVRDYGTKRQREALGVK